VSGQDVDLTLRRPTWRSASTCSVTLPLKVGLYLLRALPLKVGLYLPW